VTYFEYADNQYGGPTKYRINGAYIIHQAGPFYYGLDDDSSFAAEFHYTGPNTPGSPCVSDLGEGPMQLFHAVPKETT